MTPRPPLSDWANFSPGLRPINNKIFPTAKSVFSHDGHFGRGHGELTRVFLKKGGGFEGGDPPPFRSPCVVRGAKGTKQNLLA